MKLEKGLKNDFIIKIYNNMFKRRRGRVVKASDLKSDGIFPREFESHRRRIFFLYKNFIKHF